MASTNGHQLLAKNGSLDAPVYSFASETRTGIYFDSEAENLTIAVAGKPIALVGTEVHITVPLSTGQIYADRIKLARCVEKEQTGSFSEAIICNSPYGSIHLFKALGPGKCAKFTVFNSFVDHDTMVLVSPQGLATDHPDYYPLSAGVANLRLGAFDMIVRNTSQDTETDDTPVVKFVLL